MARKLAVLPQEANIDIDSRMFNPVYFPHLYSIHEREVYYGGSGSGKSFFVSQKLALQLTLFSGRNLVCLRKQKTDCIDSCWPDIIGALSEFKLLDYWEVKENPDHVLTNRINGNQIIFEGVDNIEDIKSIKFYNKITNKRTNLTDAWYEEANAEETISTIRELERRIRDPRVVGRILISFNPVSRAHWLFDYVTKELANSSKDVLVLKTTYKDNKFCPEAYRKMLEEYQFNSPYDYQVYTLGNWGTLGKTVFDADKIQLRLNALYGKSFQKGFFYYVKDNSTKRPKPDSYRFIDSKDGELTIFKEQELKHPYVMSVDTAGDGSDFYAAHVMDNITGEQVCVFHSDKKSEECVFQLYKVAVMYNYALVCIEANFDSWPLKTFIDMDYPNMYIRESPADKKHVKREDRYGWYTGSTNRPMMLSEMITWTGNFMDNINDVDTLNEMLVFTRQQKKMKGIWMGAEPGEHDDLVMSFAILLQARGQQSCEMIPDRKKIEGFWTRDEIEMAVESGKIDRISALEYKKEHGYYLEGDDEEDERSNRYGTRKRHIV